MSTNKFVGVAYWSVSTQLESWAAKAAAVLAPLQQDGLAVIGYNEWAGGDQLSVAFGPEQHLMPISAGKGRGTVRVSESAPEFVVCLVALRKALGDITVVTDSKENVPTVPRQTHPLYCAQWNRVLLVAQALGLATSDSFTRRHSDVLKNVF